jgi:hypothetical protein
LKQRVQKKIGDEIFNKIFHPVAVQLIDHCDAVLRIGGPSAGADEMINTGKARNKTIFYNINDIPVSKVISPLLGLCLM